MTSETPKDKSTRLITDFIKSDTTRHTSSMLSPPEYVHDQKKSNIEEITTNNCITGDPTTSTRETALAPILSEIKLLRESVHADYSKLHSDYARLEELITKKSIDVETSLSNKITNNTQKISEIAAENMELKKENSQLKERLLHIETQQLKNNIIINGVAEVKWEPYEITKTRVYEKLASVLSKGDLMASMEEARKIELIGCSRIGRYQMNRAWPISVTFAKYDDKENVMRNKRNLPGGVYINDKYPAEIKMNRDKLRPILRLAKELPQYRDKCKLSGDWLIINGITYTVDEINKLPNNLAPYLAIQKENAEDIVFHGELSPWSNFHRSLFVLNGQQYHSAEQWIQFQKAMLFGDSNIANQILRSSTPQECKRLSHYIHGVDHAKWKNEGFDLCLDGIQAKFSQNRSLYAMLKTTEPKVLVEASSDKVWGTGISLRDSQALNTNKWNGMVGYPIC